MWALWLAAGSFLRSQTGTRTSVRLHTAEENIFVTLKIGTPPQEFLVAVDTSSGNLVIPAKGCLSQACKAHRYFDVALSTSGRRLGTLEDLDGKGDPEHVQLAFARGEAHGTLAHDTACLGSLCAGLHFVEADTMSDEPFNLVPYDGIFGLAMPQLSITKNFNWMGELAELQSLKHNQFSIFIAKPGDPSGSEIVFGEFNPAHLGSEMLWVPLSSASGLWQIAVEDLAVNNGKLNVCPSGCQAAADTSTTALGLPPNLFALIEAEATVAPDCSNLATLANIGLVIDGYVLNMRPKDYVAQSGGTCTSRLYALDIPPPRGPLILLGTPFLTAFYSVYDRETLKLGLALANHHDLEASSIPELFVKLP